MKTNKIQREIFKSLMGKRRIIGTTLPENNILVSDGTIAFILQDKIINFNGAKIEMMDGLKDHLEKHPEDKQLIITDDLKILKYTQNETARKLTCLPGEYFESQGKKYTEIWVKSEYLEYFDNPQLYAFSQSKRILVVEPDVSADPCGVIMPFKLAR